LTDRLILASASPRRRELLARAGFQFEVRAAEIDESPLPGEAAAAYVERLAIEKAQAVCALYDKGLAPVTVLAADTTVVLPDGEILGKPADAEDARRMLGLLSGRTHAVMTGVAVVSSAAKKFVSALEITQVTFLVLTDDEIAAYVDTGEPLDKAGAYAIQGYAARWIPRIEGDYCNVVGLPIARTVALLAEIADSSGES
jgi:septum formation protein